MTTIDSDPTDNLTTNWQGKIKKWNLHAILPEGFQLPGKTVSKTAAGYVDHGEQFNIVETPGYDSASQDIKSEHPNANLIDFFPKDSGNVLRYWFRMKFSDEFKRSGTGYMHADFFFEEEEASQFIKDVAQNPDLADKLLLKQFPSLRDREIQPWKEIIFIPNDTTPANRNEKIQVLATKA